ncbi:Glycosyl transferase family 1 [Flavobacterium sp. 9AF]|uniref:glycosyltransferase family 4 protein n=1 Tax=Flavobacterium sp. 9AF TaxID=2653142 RepID=UPI0012F01B37|nr:glycosyltransferase family 4 protein [Flavobacterium sp. 9AF]VXC30712.1 Glycosyl transferase family 1 [Flavobacterium sp. 9AF]
MKPKIIRIATVAMSLNILLKGQLKYLNQFFDIKAVSGYDADLEMVNEREGVEIINLKMERKITPIKDFISLLKLYFLFKREKPTIVHSITPKAGLLSMIAAKYAGVPIRMHTFTGLIFPSKKGLMKKVLIVMDKILCYHATHVYPEGKGVQMDLIKYKITHKPLKIIANGNVNGVDLDYFNQNKISTNEKNELLSNLDIKENDFVFLFVGRLVKDKGINELVTAFAKSQDESVKLVLVGPFEHDLDPLLPETYLEIKNNKNIISVGFQQDVRPYMAISNVLVFPSYREGFPNVVLQAGAMELPAIVSDINGCNEIITHNKNGIIIPVKNSDAIFASMIAIREEKLYQSLKNNSREKIINQFDQNVVWQALLEEYNKVINNV